MRSPHAHAGMASLVTTLELAGSALGAVGAVLLFLEFFQMPSYVQYNEGVGYTVQMAPDDPVTEDTWIGRIGALAMAVGFACLFLATFLG